jgi:carbon storage regulator
MLVLSRRRGEGITIGQNGEIKVTVVEVRGDKVRLGIEAAQDVPVHRDEVYHAIKEQERRQQSSEEK